MVEVLTKLEYMPTFGETCGPEEVTMQEQVKWWIHTMLRPQAWLLLGRVDMLNGTVYTQVVDAVHEVRTLEYVPSLSLFSEDSPRLAPFWALFLL